MNSQQLFDTVVKHLRTQNAKSIGDDEIVVSSCDDFCSADFCSTDVCLYRSPDGMKCAVGCLIPDAEYIEEMEARPFEQFLIQDDQEVFSPTLDRIVKGHQDNKRILERLQKIHDEYQPDQWEPKFQGLAHLYDLTLAPKQ